MIIVLKDSDLEVRSVFEVETLMPYCFLAVGVGLAFLAVMLIEQILPTEPSFLDPTALHPQLRAVVQFALESSAVHPDVMTERFAVAQCPTLAVHPVQIVLFDCPIDWLFLLPLFQYQQNQLLLLLAHHRMSQRKHLDCSYPFVFSSVYLPYIIAYQYARRIANEFFGRRAL